MATEFQVLDAQAILTDNTGKPGTYAGSIYFIARYTGTNLMTLTGATSSIGSIALIMPVSDNSEKRVMFFVNAQSVMLPNYQPIRFGPAGPYLFVDNITQHLDIGQTFDIKLAFEDEDGGKCSLDVTVTVQEFVSLVD